MFDNKDLTWKLIQNALTEESTGKEPKLFSSKRTLFGIASSLEQDLATINLSQSNISSTNEQKPNKDINDCAGKKEQEDKSKPKLVTHPLDPIFNKNSQILLLGTMPSPTSRQTHFYYNHPQNRFWKVLAKLFNETVPETNDQKKKFVLRHHIALWDVLSQCEIIGAKDNTIAQCVPQNLNVILNHASIKKIFCIGAKAAQLYRLYSEEQTNLPCVKLPSTSSANSAWSLDQLVSAYSIIVPYCN